MPSPNANVATLTITIPRILYDRAKKVSGTFRCAMVQMLRDGLALRVDHFENELERIKEKREQEKTDRRRGRGLRSINQSIGTPVKPLEPFAPSTTLPVSPFPDVLAPVYKEYAQAIVDAGEDKDEVRRRVNAAIRAVKKRAPLTHPIDEVIIERLEEEVVQIQNRPVRTVDGLVGAVIDPKAIPTQGDVEPK